jgi:hypothetical protein
MDLHPTPSPRSSCQDLHQTNGFRSMTEYDTVIKLVTPHPQMIRNVMCAFELDAIPQYNVSN